MTFKPGDAIGMAQASAYRFIARTEIWNGRPQQNVVGIGRGSRDHLRAVNDQALLCFLDDMECETGIRLLGPPLAAIDLRIVQSVCQEQVPCWRRACNIRPSPPAGRAIAGRRSCSCASSP